MSKTMVPGIVAMALFASAATAECPDATAGSGVVRPLDPTNKTDADLIVSMSMMPKLMKISYRTAASAGKLACDLIRFSAGGTEYDLRASPMDRGTARIAAPKIKGAPIAELVPVTDMVEAIAASKAGKAAPVSGYMLATISAADVTGWRLYTAVPSQATLVADMSAAIEQRIKPVFRTDTATNKTSLLVTG